MIRILNSKTEYRWLAAAVGLGGFNLGFLISGTLGVLHISLSLLNNSEILLMLLTPIVIFWILSSRSEISTLSILLCGPSLLLSIFLGFGLLCAYLLSFFKWTRISGKIIFGILSIPAAIGLLIVPFGSLLGGEALMKSQKVGDKLVTQYIIGRGHTENLTLYVETPIWSVISFRKQIDNAVDQPVADIEILDSKHFKYSLDGMEHVVKI